MHRFTVDFIETAPRPELLELWRELHSTPAPRSISVQVMRRILAFDVQARERGGLPKTFHAALKKEVARDDTKAPHKHKNGARFVREWNGRTHIVDLIEGRYHWNKNTYWSLSAIAREITGAHWLGPRFFGCAEARRQ